MGKTQGIILNNLCCSGRHSVSLCIGDGNRASSNELGSETFAVRPRK
jgi:hypothetical protein